MPANKNLIPSKMYVTGFAHEKANNQEDVINSRGKKVVLRNSNGKIEFVTIAAL